MKLFVSQKANITSEDPAEKVSKLLEVFATYACAIERNLVSLVTVSDADQKALKIQRVPMMVTSTGNDGEEPTSCANPISIMIEIAKAAYLDEVLFCAPTSKERFEILSFIELAQSLPADELCERINKHLTMRMFLVGLNITAADIIMLLYVSEYFRDLEDFQKIALPNAFRWIDHIQHLPGLAEQVETLGLFVSFPDETQSQPSKAQLKKLEKIAAAKAKKAEKKVGGAKEPEAKAGKQEKQGAPAAGEEKKEKQEKKPKQQQQQKQQKGGAPKKTEEAPLHELSKVDIRVGKIIWVEKNPNSEKLYNEKVDIGNGEIRDIASGLQKVMTLEDMQDAMVCVITNLRPRPLAGWKSHGMVLCAETPDGSAVEFLHPPEGSQPGDQVSFEGYPRQPLEQLPAKKSPWDLVAPRLVIDEAGVGCYSDEASGKNIPFKSDKGIFRATKIANGIIK